MKSFTSFKQSGLNSSSLRTLPLILRTCIKIVVPLVQCMRLLSQIDVDYWRIWTPFLLSLLSPTALEKPLLLSECLLNEWKIEWIAPRLITTFTLSIEVSDWPRVTVRRTLRLLKNLESINSQIYKLHGHDRSVGSTARNSDLLDLGQWERLNWVRLC